MPGSIRKNRIADLIQREIALIIQNEVSDPRLSNMIVTAVDMSDDLHIANVHFALLEQDDPQPILACLIKAKGFIRRELSRRVELRYTPDLKFSYDESEARAARIKRLINEGSHGNDDSC